MCLREDMISLLPIDAIAREQELKGLREKCLVHTNSPWCLDMSKVGPGKLA